MVEYTCRCGSPAVHQVRPCRSVLREVTDARPCQELTCPGCGLHLSRKTLAELHRAWADHGGTVAA
jgi:hypothetical protein